MPKASDLPLEKQPLPLSAGQYEDVQARYPSMDAAHAIREIIRLHLEAAAAQESRPPIQVSTELDHD